MTIRNILVGSAKLAALAVVLVTTLAQAAQYSRVPEQLGSDDTTYVRGSGHAFKISGHVKGLYPGKAAKLVTTLRNPNPTGIRVTLIKAKVASAPGCPAKNIKITPFKGKRYIGSGHTVKVKLKITMKAKAPNGCQGDKLRLKYHGKAVKA